MKVKGFKMMLGAWAKDLSGEELLELNVSQCGYGNIIDGGNISDPIVEYTIPPNKMVNFDIVSTIMTFEFDEVQDTAELPAGFLESAKGIEIGFSNTELLYV